MALSDDTELMVDTRFLKKRFDLFFGKTNGAAYVAMTPKLAKICNKIGNNLIIISGAKSKFDMRNPEQLAAIGSLMSMEKSKQLWSVSNAYEVLM